ncbi:hypothetical protein OCGS_0292 [Oceaniovalibus guishaninsula JLT2003]|uniref:Uncharacterized protein n=1 Tax=Oceaniovalibus guishaninsula JLT2003 TaxID=1231392 RepID=K2I9Q4_9RHOB|nr:hypothetical protein OCGS_0292 [Oceaniovalibus guishaninsula JLT2003]
MLVRTGAGACARRAARRFSSASIRVRVASSTIEPSFRRRRA